ncbi:hypothetical protein FV139_02585 [Parahaliea maris]|uniref:DUF3558 domain-containing protein n=1 Tax=Parahaliea maris TaxID=2716870 RepID=A0A5C9A6D3_9GAMM|nr:hypothetical protein [Parahaliea maris]TXS96398.1 hypothetical protein FV139_02585 [Parahaliea maris]
MRARLYCLTFLLLQALSADAAKLPPKIDEIPNACGYLTEEIARSVLGPEVRPFQSNEHIPVFYSQCEYKGTGPGRHSLRFVFKFMVKEMFDVDKLAPEQIDFNAGFAEGGQTFSEKLQYPGKLTYIFHDRDTTSVLVITGVDGPLDGAGQPSALIFSYRLIDGDRTPEQRRDLLMKFAWRHLIDLAKSQ